jgi:hypothetical protein
MYIAEFCINKIPSQESNFHVVGQFHPYKP